MQSIPSLAIFEASSHPPQQTDGDRHSGQAAHDDTDVNISSDYAGENSMEYAVTSHGNPQPATRLHTEEASQPLQSRDARPQPRADYAELQHATTVQRAEQHRSGQNRAARSFEHLLDSLPDIDLDIPSPPELLQRSDGARAQHSAAEALQAARVPQHTPEAHETRAQHARHDAQSSEQGHRQAPDKQRSAQGGQNFTGAGERREATVTNESAEELYTQPTQKQLKKQKKQGVLVPQVDTALQACRKSVSPGVATIQPSPGSGSLPALASAVESLSKPPASRRRAAGASAHARNAATAGRPRAQRRVPMPQHDASPQPPTRFIADLQMDLAARLLAKQPNLAHGQKSPGMLGMLGRPPSQPDMLLEPRQWQHGTASGIAALEARAAAQQARATHSIQQAAGQAPFGGESLTALLQGGDPSEQGAWPGPAGPSMGLCCRTAEPAPAPSHHTTHAPASAFRAVRSGSNGTGSTVQAPSMESRVMPTVDLQALMRVMAASEQTAVALEQQQLAASYHAASASPSGAVNGLLCRLWGQPSIPLYSLPGIPISLQQPWPAQQAQMQGTPNGIAAHAILQGHPIGMRALQGQPSGLGDGTGPRNPPQQGQITQDALAAALRTLRQESLLHAREAPQRSNGSPAGYAASPQAATQEADPLQAYQLPEARGIQAEARAAFASPSLFALPEGMPATPLAEDASLARLWHGTIEKR